MATKKKVRIRTATQLEANGWTLKAGPLGAPCYEHTSGDKIPQEMFIYFGTEITERMDATILLGTLTENSWDATLQTWTSMPTLTDYELETESGGIVYLTVWDDMGMNVIYKHVNIDLSPTEVLTLKALFDALPT